MSVNSFPQQVLRSCARREIPRLHSRGPKRLQSPLIRLDEGHAPVRQVVLLTQILHNRRDLPQVATRQPREQMMLELKLKPTEEPIPFGRTIDINRPTRLFLEPIVPLRSSFVHVCSEMVQTELHVLDGRHAEAHQHEQEPLGPCRHKRDEKRKPGPEDEDPDYVQRSVGHSSFGEQKQESLKI